MMQAAQFQLPEGEGLDACRDDESQSREADSHNLRRNPFAMLEGSCSWVHGLCDSYETFRGVLVPGLGSKRSRVKPFPAFFAQRGPRRKTPAQDTH